MLTITNPLLVIMAAGLHW